MCGVSYSGLVGQRGILMVGSSPIAGPCIDRKDLKNCW